MCLTLVLEDRQCSQHMHRRVEDLTPITQDGEETGRSQAVAEVTGETHPRVGEPFNRHEGGLRFGEPFSEVRGGC